MMLLQAEAEVANVLRAWVPLWSNAVLSDSVVPRLQSQEDPTVGFLFHSADLETVILHFFVTQKLPLLLLRSLCYFLRKVLPMAG